jgi:hypothetical protein
MQDDGSPLHFERGFFRPAGTGRVEIVLAHPLGITEVAEGLLGDRALEVASTSVGVTSTGSPVTALRRTIRVEGDRLRYQLEMATRDVAIMRHLAGELTRA